MHQFKMTIVGLLSSLLVSYIIILISILDTAESHQQKIISLLISDAAVECLLGVGKLGRSL